MAAQTLSNSIADAIEFLMVDIKHPFFQEVGATIAFIRLVDRIFDLLNSRNLIGRSSKSPLKPLNFNYWRPIVEQAIQGHHKTSKRIC